MPLTDDAAATLQAGGLVVAVDPTAQGGRGRGVFVHAAALATTQTVNQAIFHGRGLTCFSVTPEQAMRLGLMLAGEMHAGHHGPLFLRSVEAAACDGTGISAEDRALTLRAAGAPDAGIASLKSPGHVLPAMTNGGGMADLAARVLRAHSTHDVAAWCDILDDWGEVADAAWCRDVAGRAGVPCLG